MKIIMLICFVPLVPIMYALLRNEAKLKKNVSLGVTLPYAARKDPYVLEVWDRYKKWLTAVCAALFVLQFPLYFISSLGVFVLLYMVWMMLVIVLPYLPFLSCHKRLKAYKEEKGWLSGQQGSMVVDLTAAAGNKPSPSAWWFLLPVVVSALPMLIEALTVGADSWAYVLVNLLMTAVVASFYLFFRIINRQRADVVEENPTLNQALTRIRRYNWSKLWLWMAWLTGALQLCMWLLEDSAVGFMVLMALYITLTLFVVLRTEFAARSAQYQLTTESGRAGYIDEDQFWPYGIFYYNPNDKHLMINHRTGIGTTINMGRTAGKVLTGLCALLVLLLPLTGVWIILEETAPLTIEVTATELIAAHTGAYHVALDEIQSAELLETWPSGSVRVMGTGLDNLAKGTFQVPDIGRCELSLDPTIAPFLLLRTDDKTYLFGTRNPDDTIHIYREIQAG